MSLGSPDPATMLLALEMWMWFHSIVWEPELVIVHNARLQREA